MPVFDWPRWCVLAGYFAIPSLAMLERLLQVMLPQLPSAITTTVNVDNLYYGIIVLYLIILLGLGKPLLQWFSRFLWQRCSLAAVVFLALLTLLVLCLGFAWLYPLADSGQLGFRSDRDEALNIAARALLRGEFPYLCRATVHVHEGCPDTGNLIAPLPGAVLLATPFVILGNSAYQNFFWLIILFLVVAVYAGGIRSALSFNWMVLLLAPVLIAEMMTGGDLTANSIYLAVLLLCWLKQTLFSWRLLLIAFVFGIALSSRGHFVLLLPVIAMYCLRCWGWWRALLLCSAVLAGFLLLTLPFYLVNPNEFTPLKVQQKLALFTAVLPHAQELIVLISLLLGMILGYKVKSLSGVLHTCALVILLPVLAAVLLNSVRLGYPTFLYYGWYALSSMFFVALAVWLDWLQTNRSLLFSGE